MLVGMSLAAQALTAPQRAALDATLQALVDRPGGSLASLTVAALRDGQIVYEAGFGQRSVGGAPATPDTLYRVASISKVLTAIGVMQQVEAGRLDLDADLSGRTGLCTLRNPHFPLRAVTARMLLSHTGSLRDAGDLPGHRADTPLSQVLTPAFWADAAAQAPGAGWFHYANINHAVLGTLIERLSGERFDRYMVRHVLRPLGMPGGFYPAEDLNADDIARLATLYRRGADDSHWQPDGPWQAQGPDRSGMAPAAIDGLGRYPVGSNAGIFAPQGGLRTSVQGLARLARLLIQRGTLDGVTVLQPASVAAMLSPQWTHNGPAGAPNGDTDGGLLARWGLGLQGFDLPGLGLVGAGHLGEAYGLLGAWIVDPAAGSALVLLIGGVSDDPARHRGTRTPLTIWEEDVLDALQQQAVGGHRR